MKATSREQFMRMPAGTVYAKGSRWAFGELMVKHDTLFDQTGERAIDWLYWAPTWPAAHDTGEALHMLDKSIEDGSSFGMDDGIGRDGCFADDEVFLIFEAEDLERLNEVVAQALAVCRGSIKED